MCDLGITPENFNPRILYILKRQFTNHNIYTPHAHDFISLIYVLSGSCTYTINNELYEVKKGNIIVCNPGVIHERKLTLGEKVTEFHIGFNNVYIKNLPNNFLIADTACPVITLINHEQEFYRCCYEMSQEQEKNGPGTDLILKALAMKLIVLILKETYYTENLEDKFGFNFETYDKETIVNTIASFMSENYMENISLDMISKNMYLSPVYISKIFKDETGESPINYLIKMRLSKAKELLEEGHMTVKEVAENVGYTDAYHFSKLFKKYYGYPPSKCR